MIKLLSFEAKHLSHTDVELKWKFKPTPESISDYSLNVYGGAEYDVMNNVSGNILASNLTFIHSFETPRPYNENYYYRIEWFLNSDPSTIKKSENILTDPPIDPITAELRNKEELKLRFTGLKCAIYIRIKNDSGKRCAYCWDEITRRVVDKTCRHCGGTGFWGGYFPPIYKNVNISLDDYQMIDNGNTGKTGELSSVIEMGAFPKLNLNDLIVEEAKGNVWRLVSHGGSEVAKLRNHTKQIWRAKAADKNIIEDIKKFRS